MRDQNRKNPQNVANCRVNQPTICLFTVEKGKHVISIPKSDMQAFRKYASTVIFSFTHGGLCVATEKKCNCTSEKKLSQYHKYSEYD